MGSQTKNTKDEKRKREIHQKGRGRNKCEAEKKSEGKKEI